MPRENARNNKKIQKPPQKQSGSKYPIFFLAAALKLFPFEKKRKILAKSQEKNPFPISKGGFVDGRFPPRHINKSATISPFFSSSNTAAQYWLYMCEIRVGLRVLFFSSSGLCPFSAAATNVLFLFLLLNCIASIISRLHNYKGNNLYHVRKKEEVFPICTHFIVIFF